jgi:hypothetical protein
VEGLELQWLQYAKYNAAGAYTYFVEKVIFDRSDQMAVAELGRLCNPKCMSVNRFSPRIIRDFLGGETEVSKKIYSFAPSLKIFQELIGGLVTELSQYHTAVMEIDAEAVGRTSASEMKFAEDFWRSHRLRLPTWFRLARLLMTFPTSSAAAERVFSILKRSFAKNQKMALLDTVASSVMLQYNKR